MASLGLPASWDPSADDASNKPGLQKTVSMSTSILERGGGDNWNSPAASAADAVCPTSLGATPTFVMSDASGGCLFTPSPQPVFTAQSLVASSAVADTPKSAALTASAAAMLATSSTLAPTPPPACTSHEAMAGSLALGLTPQPGDHGFDSQLRNEESQPLSSTDPTATARQHCLAGGIAAASASGSGGGATGTEPSSGGVGAAATTGPPPSLAYFEELVRDKSQLTQLPANFQHLNKLLEVEIDRVKSAVKMDGVARLDATDLLSEDGLPEPVGDMVTRQERITVPVDKYPEYNFAGRILGPRGMTVKQLEQKTGCRILVRGRGSLKSRASGDSQEREELHVMVIVEDTANRAQIKLDRAKHELEKLLNPGNEGMDDLKKKQLMELAIINGTYRPPPHLTAACAGNTLGMQHRGLLRAQQPSLAGFPNHPTGALGSATGPGGGWANLQPLVAGPTLGGPMMLPNGGVGPLQHAGAALMGPPHHTQAPGVGATDPATLVGAPQSFLSGFQQQHAVAAQPGGGGGGGTGLTVHPHHHPHQSVGVGQAAAGGLGVGGPGTQPPHQQPYVLAQLAPAPAAHHPGTPSAAAAAAQHMQQQMAAAGPMNPAAAAMMWPQAGGVPGTVYLPWLPSNHPAGHQLSTAGYGYLTTAGGGSQAPPSAAAAAGYTYATPHFGAPGYPTSCAGASYMGTAGGPGHPQAQPAGLAAATTGATGAVGTGYTSAASQAVAVATQDGGSGQGGPQHAAHGPAVSAGLCPPGTQTTSQAAAATVGVPGGFYHHHQAMRGSGAVATGQQLDSRSSSNAACPTGADVPPPGCGPPGCAKMGGAGAGTSGGVGGNHFHMIKQETK